MAALRDLYWVNENAVPGLDGSGIWYDSGLNINFRKSWESKGICWISDVCDSSRNPLTREELQPKFQIGINSLDYESLKYRVKKRLLRYNLNKRYLAGSNLPVILHMIRIADKVCLNVYIKQLLGTNTEASFLG